MEIREANPTDLSLLLPLFQEALPGETVSDALLREKLFPEVWSPGRRGHVLLAERDGVPCGALQVVTGESKGWFGLFAVAGEARRQGVARALMDRAWAGFGEAIEEVEVLAIPGNYLYPGLDPRWTGALCLLESFGFERFNDCVNLTVQLDRSFPVSAAIADLRAKGVEVRRATAADADRLEAFFAAQFGADWLFEASAAAAQDPPCLHLALRDGEILGFAGHSSQNRSLGFFGPMGTTPAARGLGIGRVLLWCCLEDLRAAGHPTAVIPWVGPIRFYHQASAAVVERVFWRYRRKR